MANRLSKIYTRTGDDGNTGMADGSRVAKDSLLIQVIGEIDELNSQLAVLVCHAPEDISDAVRMIQNELFNAGAELSMGQVMIEHSHVDMLEKDLDALNGKLKPLKEFILPGGGLAASHCHVARAVCRRAERSLVSLNNQKKQNPFLMAYVNRLSDYLFVLARVISRRERAEETYWRSSRIERPE